MFARLTGEIHSRHPIRESGAAFPLTTRLSEALTTWLAVHPGGRSSSCQAGEVARSKKRGRTTGHKSGEARATTDRGRAGSVERREIPDAAALTPSECHDHFERTSADSSWGIVEGPHTPRHGFISAAAAGVDRRIIDDIVGHTSGEIKRRYRHPTPDAKSRVVAAVFDSAANPTAATAAPPRAE